MKPVTDQAYKLLHNGCIALAQVESYGIRIDTDYLQKSIDQSNQQIDNMASELQKDDIYKQWVKKYKDKFTWESGEQLGDILFNVLNHDPTGFTKTGRPKTDEESLRATELPFVDQFLKMKKLRKATNTYLVGILRHTQDGYLHPFFDLHIPVSYRGSSSSPNFQNIPIRDFEIGKLVRQAFLAREGRRIIEVDF